MLQRDENHSRSPVGVPVRREVAAALTAAPARLSVTARRAEREVSLIVDDRILGVGMSVVILGQEDSGAEEDGMAPPFGEDLALDLDALHVLVIGGKRQRGDNLVGDESDRFG